MLTKIVRRWLQPILDRLDRIEQRIADRERVATRYDIIGYRVDKVPITGGHHDDFTQVREDAELLLRHGPFAFDCHRVDVLDALGRIVWSKERLEAE